MVKFEITNLILDTSLTFSIDSETASKEVETLCEDLEGAGLHTEVRAGYEKTLLIFVRAPREVLGKAVHKSRYVKGPSNKLS